MFSLVFLASGETLEVLAHSVDANPQYADAIDEEAFRMHLVFGSDINPPQPRSSGYLELPEYNSHRLARFEGGLIEVIAFVCLS